MANQVKMSVRCAIIELYGKGWPKLRIAGELGIDVKTVRRYVRLEEGSGSTSLQVPAGNGGENDSNSLQVPAGSGDSKPSIVPTGKTGCFGHRSQCAAHHQRIVEGVEKGLSAQRIWQDLVGEEGFEGAYDAVKRYVRKLRGSQPKCFERMECEPGEEVQVDFGTGAPILTAEGKRRRTHVLRVVLSHSRKGYSEAVLRQDTESFIRAIENAFRYFGGVPKTVVIDNLKAAVSRADWYDPDLNPKIQAFARHYGTTILPTRPYTPRHKGKVERGVGYVKGNALKGRVFTSLAEENEHLKGWEANVADQRIHGTTRKQVKTRFENAERDALQPLPLDLFPCFKEAKRSVHRDGFVEVDKAYYEVPEEYVTRQVWVRWDARLVRVFNSRWEQIAVHARIEPGRFSRAEGARHRRRGPVQRSKEYLLGEAGLIGSFSGVWAQAMLVDRGPAGIRVLMGFLGLTRKHPARVIEKACERALAHGAYRLADIRRLLEQPDDQDTFTFLEAHPLIRDMDEYGSFVEQLTTTPMEECAYE